MVALHCHHSGGSSFNCCGQQPLSYCEISVQKPRVVIQKAKEASHTLTDPSDSRQGIRYRKDHLRADQLIMAKSPSEIAGILGSWFGGIFAPLVAIIIALLAHRVSQTIAAACNTSTTLYPETVELRNYGKSCGMEGNWMNSAGEDQR